MLSHETTIFFKFAHKNQSSDLKLFYNQPAHQESDPTLQKKTIL